MTTVTVLYPASDGSTFDHDYYLKTHIPLVRKHWQSFGLSEVTLLRGTGAPGGSAAFLMIALLAFPSLQDFQRAADAHGKEVLGDVPNFTNVKPVLQFSETVG